MKKLIIAALIFASFSAIAAEQITPEYIRLEICHGTSAIHQGSKFSKLFMILNNGEKVAYSNQYGQHGSTTFKYHNGLHAETAFEKGVIVHYSGVKDASGICVPYTLDFK
jgi:hypothetical protein